MKAIVERPWPDSQQAGTRAFLGDWVPTLEFHSETLKRLTAVRSDHVDEELLLAWKKRTAICLGTTLLFGQLDEASKRGDTRNYAALVDQVKQTPAGPTPIDFELERVRRLMVKRYEVPFPPLDDDLSADQLDEDRSVPIPIRTAWLGHVRLRESAIQSRVGFQCLAPAAAYLLATPLPNLLVMLPGAAVERSPPFTRWTGRISFQSEAASRDGILCTFRNHRDEVIWRTICSQEAPADGETSITAECRWPEPVASISLEPAKLGELTRFDGHSNIPQPGSMPLPPSPIRHVAVSLDGRWLASADKDGFVLVREVWTGKTRISVRMKEPVTSLMLSDDGHYLGVGSGRDRMDEQGKVLSPLTGPPPPGGRENVDEQGRPLRASGVLRIWDLESSALVCESTSYSSPVRILSFSRSGSQCLTVGGLKNAENGAQIWSTVDGRLAASFAGHRAPIVCGVLSVDGKTVATADHRGMVLHWEAGSGKELLRLAAGVDPYSVLQIGFSPNATMLSAVIRAGDKYRELSWFVATGRFIGEGKPRSYRPIAEVPMRSSFPSLVGPSVPLLIVFDPRSGKEIRVDPPILGIPTCATLFGDGRFLAVGLEDGRAVVWLLRSAEPYDR